MTWNGATLYKSADAGATYTPTLSIASSATIGLASTVLGDFAGGNIFDELNTVDVALRAGGPLVSYTELQVLNGAGLCVLGTPGRWEVLQYKTATLIGTNLYRLSGFLRGRRGTEWAIRTHAAGDKFVLASLSSWSRVNSGTDEIGLERLYKGVTARGSVVDAKEQAFTNSAVGKECYAPVHLGFGRDADNNLILTWTRRTRLGGEWRDKVDVSLGEELEQYVVEVTSNDYTHVIRITPFLARPTWTYAASEQIDDFGEIYDNPHFKIYQFSTTHGRGSALFGCLIPDGNVPAPELPYVPGEESNPRYGQTYGPWTMLDPMAEARSSHVAFVVGERILHVAGTFYSGGFIRNDGKQEWFTPETGRWKKDTEDSLPVVWPIEAQLAAATAFSYGGTYYAIGRPFELAGAQVFEYDPDTLFAFGVHWRYRIDILLDWEMRDQYGALLGDKVYYPTVGLAIDMTGGPVTSIASIKALLGCTFIRCNSVSEIGGLIYLLGVGDVFISGSDCVRTYIYDPATDTLTAGATCPQPLWGCTSVVLDGKIHVMGGAVANQSFVLSDRHLAYDPVTDTWAIKASLPPVLYISDGSVQFGNTYNSTPGRGGFSAVEFGGKLYLAGGNGFGAGQGGAITGENTGVPYILSYAKLTLEYDPNLDP